MLEEFDKIEIIFYDKYRVKMNSKSFNLCNFTYFNPNFESGIYLTCCNNIIKNTNYQSFIEGKDSESLKNSII